MEGSSSDEPVESGGLEPSPDSTPKSADDPAEGAELDEPSQDGD